MFVKYLNISLIKNVFLSPRFTCFEETFPRRALAEFTSSGDYIIQVVVNPRRGFGKSGRCLLEPSLFIHYPIERESHMWCCIHFNYPFSLWIISGSVAEHEETVFHTTRWQHHYVMSCTRFYTPCRLHVRSSLRDGLKRRDTVDVTESMPRAKVPVVQSGARDKWKLTIRHKSNAFSSAAAAATLRPRALCRIVRIRELQWRAASRSFEIGLCYTRIMYTNNKTSSPSVSLLYIALLLNASS